MILNDEFGSTLKKTSLFEMTEETLEMYIHTHTHTHESGLLSSLSDYTHKITTPCDKNVHLGVASFLQICEKGCPQTEHTRLTCWHLLHTCLHTLWLVFSRILIESYVMINSCMFGDNHCNMSNVLAFLNTARLAKCI